jgi:Iap family predicted aminopeptidase
LKGKEIIMQGIIKQVKCLGVNDNKTRRKRLIKLLQAKSQQFILQDIPNDGGQNIIIPARDIDNEVIVLCSHFDVVQGSHGFNDNASGVTSLLNTLGVLPDNVEVVFTDEEEVGCSGSRYYIQELDTAISFAVNVDVVGLGGNVFADVGECNSLIDILPDSCRSGHFPFCDSDIFRRAKIPTITFSTGPGETFREALPHINMSIHGASNDNILDIIEPDSIQAVTSIIIDLVNENTAKKIAV